MLFRFVPPMRTVVLLFVDYDYHADTVDFANHAVHDCCVDSVRARHLGDQGRLRRLSASQGRSTSEQSHIQRDRR